VGNAETEERFLAALGMTAGCGSKDPAGSIGKIAVDSYPAAAFARAMTFWS
jgi:hypothetical protein